MKVKVSKKRWWLGGAIAICAVILMTLIAAPSNQKLNSGSTYSRAPDGYGAWYAFMSEQGLSIQRWQKPFSALAKPENADSKIALLQITSSLKRQSIYGYRREWVEQGNTLILLGIQQPVTPASFSSEHDSQVGVVRIDTARRKQKAEQVLLGDRFGAIVWEEKLGEGRVILATTPYLAANAYQDSEGNYEFLAKLVTQDEYPIWVDEYIHGYKDAEAIEREGGGDIFSYLVNTPLFPLLIQGSIILLVAILAVNRRLGPALTLTASVVDNSKAYIEALAAVLRKAGNSEFVVEVVSKDEQLQLQKMLGLSEVLLDRQSLIDAWVQQTGRPATEIQHLLQIQSKQTRMSEAELATWLGKLAQLRDRFLF